ncbi:right-handed parallel beta-helix repeat-containing protein [Sneathiella chinensis]|uniref:Right handed beta helix domain-containing protein n=1 Tax=Sneathiella chinensis TaxID=349750 RepID=A0ABQ5U187_9PROT|nr:right-handed parallel beta-helix repeat-containing protein [Sneathiella chinensis]GLQ05957.1 hypothetical protein GCM10007924_11780 [Sneathiella chinensis]
MRQVFCQFIALLGAILLSGIGAEPALAKIHHVNPAGATSAKPDGSSAKPWPDLSALVSGDALQGGDTVLLGSGFYGALYIRGLNLPQPVLIQPEAGATARFSNVRVHRSSNLHLKGLTVSPSFATPHSNRKIVEIDQNAHNITIEGFEIFSVPDSTGWTGQDWNAKAGYGIFGRGHDFVILNNSIRNVSFGISMHSSRTQVIGNSVVNFSGDGLRGLGDDSLFEGNTVKNCYQVNGNHADGFQSWSVGPTGKIGTGVIKNVILRGNLFLNYEDPNQPFRCKMQGIGLFGGVYQNWVIENNIVLADNWHGITVMGARNVRIVNNTVLDPNNQKPGPAWIRIAEQHQRQALSGNVVANNIASALNSSKWGVVQKNNLIFRSPRQVFIDPGRLDFRLPEGSEAIDAGLGGIAAKTDFYGNRRPQGAGIDVGAVEKLQGGQALQ